MRTPNILRRQPTRLRPGLAVLRDLLELSHKLKTWLSADDTEGCHR
jgi:hypothetical protein